MDKFKFKKKYGQNFLNDKKVVEKISDSISPEDDDLIIEIGPGAGSLTKELKKHHSYLIAIEIDEDTKKYLLPLEDEKTKIIYTDILNADLNQLVNLFPHKKTFIIGNLPYYITTPIIEKIISSKIDYKSLTIMVQKEVADRFLALPYSRDYGYMTVILNYWFDISKVTDVDRKKFTPSPNVDSTVLFLERKETKPVEYDKLVKIVKQSFQFKRKTIANNLKSYDRDRLDNILKAHNHSLTDRAEDLELEVFLDLSQL